MNLPELEAHLTTKEVAARLRTTEQTLFKWRKKKRGPKFVVRCGRIFYPLRDLDDWYRNGDSPTEAAE